MIRKASREIVQVVSKSKIISLILKGGKVLYQSVRSCFGAGYWIDDKPWLDDEAWKD